jgi:hypothetical protein
MMCVGLSAWAQQLPLSESNVIGSSGSRSGESVASNIFDQQVGTPTDVAGNFWLSPNEPNPLGAFITIDLGQAYRLDSISLFNTHNDFFYNRGTGQFQILGGNTVVDLGGSNFQLTGTTSTLISGSLSAVWTSNPPEVQFQVTDPGSYRYLAFQPLTVASANPPPTPTSFGLNEMRVVVSAVPEASTSAMMLAGVAVVGWLAARRRRPG